MSSIFKNKPFTSGIKDDDFISKGMPRILELFLASTGLLILSPVLIICAFLVWASSTGGIFFRQKRVGLNGQTFTLFKFRTMIVSVDGLPITAANDRRITKVGKFLRKWKLDELPEIYNVLYGDMSFVGPRPEVPELVDFSNPDWNLILKVRPGITDTVTLRLRNEETILATIEDKETFYREIIQPFKINGYLEYLENKSLKTDLKIIVKTLKVIMFPQSAKPPTLKKVSIT